MGKRNQRDEEDFINEIVNIIRLTTNNNKEVNYRYETFLKNEVLTSYQKKYFKSIIFDKIPYHETCDKMRNLLKSDINKATFTGKELKNIQRFFREQKLKYLKDGS